jgi:hypothetical protein
MNLIWRFYSDSDQRWRWQHLSFSGAVLAESSKAYAEYEGCLASATEQGYVFLPPLSTRPKSSSGKVRRTYVHRRKPGKPKKVSL